MILQNKRQNHAYCGINAYQAHIKNKTGVVRSITGKEGFSKPVQPPLKLQFLNFLNLVKSVVGSETCGLPTITLTDLL